MPLPLRRLINQIMATRTMITVAKEAIIDEQDEVENHAADEDGD